MNNVSLNLSRDDFLNSEFGRIIDNTEVSYNFHSYAYALHQRSVELHSEGDINSAVVLEILSGLYTYMLVEDSNNEPFKPLCDLGDKRSLLPDDLTTEQLKFLNAIKEDVQEPFLRARIAEVLWLRSYPQRNIDNIRRAIDTYTAFELTPSNIHSDLRTFWKRAVHLSITFKDQERQDCIKGKLLNYLRNAKVENSGFASVLSEIMQTSYYKKYDQEEIVSILEKFISDAKKNKDWEHIRQCADTAILWYKQLNQVGNECRLKAEVAQSYYEQAEIQTENPRKGYLYEQASHWYRKIPRAFREQFNVENCLNTTSRKMKEANTNSVCEMKVISSDKIDISDYVKKAQEDVTQIPYPVVLLRLSKVTDFSGKEYYEKIAKEILKEVPIYRMMGCTTFSQDGRVVNRTPGIALNKEGDNTEAFWSQMLDTYKIYIEMTVPGSIIPALDVITIEHHITFQMLLAICRHSTVVEEGREFLWAKGLYFGFEKDWVSAIHLLTPQIEHYVRCQLQQADIKTSTIDSDRHLEKENGLSTLLDLPEAEKVLGTDFHFELQAMLSRPAGFNMRNNLAHGLLDFGQCHSYVAIYFWWFCLKLVTKALPWQVK